MTTPVATPAMRGSNASPVTAVMAALDAGATTRQAVAGVTGLRLDVVDAAVDFLLRTGRARGLDTACGAGGCAGCPTTCRD